MNSKKELRLTIKGRNIAKEAIKSTIYSRRKLCTPKMLWAILLDGSGGLG